MRAHSPSQIAGVRVLPDSSVEHHAAGATTSGFTSSRNAELIAHPSATNLDLLFEQYSRLVLGTAYRILGDANEAEEVVQDVFLYLYRKAHCFDPSKGSVRTWVLQIAVSRSLDRKVHLSRRRSLTSELGDSERLHCEANLDQQIDASLRRKYLERAFADLTDMQRRTIEFFYFDGLDLREISEELSEPLGRVRHYYYRGLERLRKSSLLHRLRL